MKQFDFNKVSEVLDYMSSTGLKEVTTNEDINISVTIEGDIKTYMLLDSEGYYIAEDNRALFLQRVNNCFLEGGKIE